MINFTKGQAEDFTKSEVMKLYTNVKRRMESRYMQQGEVPGLLFLVSSKKSEYDFLEQYTKTQINNPNTFIVDDPVWNIKPKSYYSGEWFQVAIGNKFVKSTIVKDGENPSEYLKQGYSEILNVPVEHREAFELDIDSALMDIANVPVESKSKFISFDRLSKNYDQHRTNPFSMEVLTIGMDDSLEIKDFFKEEQVDDYTRSLSGFIHIDTSVRGDRTGLSYVCISGTKNVNKYKRNENSISIENENDLVYKQVFTIGIQAPSNSEISFEKTRTFIYYLRSIGFNIRGVSADGFQSVDTIQQLTLAGYNAKKISLDRTDEGYMTFKQAINEERLDLLNLRNTLLEKEIIDLQREGATGKVDHPSNGCLPGNTFILINNGIKKIKDLNEKKDKIYSYDLEHKTIVESNFINLRLTKFVNYLILIETDDKRQIFCTENHPILSVSGYLRADNLYKGIKLIDSVKGFIMVNKISKIFLSECIPVYDIEVPKYNNFLLANGLIVHNSKDESDSLCGAIFNASKSKFKDQMIHAQDDAEITAELLDIYDSERNMNDILGIEGRVVNDYDNLGFDDDLII